MRERACAITHGREEYVATANDAVMRNAVCMVSTAKVPRSTVAVYCDSERWRMYLARSGTNTFVAASLVTRLTCAIAMGATAKRTAGI